uniref:SAC3/GANP/THP3 conserved domain-containing protein n=1 Tax=Chaetoceros debilis TaxID=122233 RepID=A0A7S3Q3R7_9STRA
MYNSRSVSERWNGHSWVPQYQQHQTPLSVPPPTTDVPKIPAHLEGIIDPMTASAKQLTQFFSKVYQYWAGQKMACQTSGDTSSSAYQWSDYYSNLSKYAALHYNHLVPNSSADFLPGSSASAQIILSEKKNKKAKNNTSATTMASIPIPLDGDFISLSSLSSARSVNVKAKKKNKKAAKKLKENANEFGSGFGFNGTASKLASRANRFSGQGGITDASSEDKLASYSQNIDRYMGKTIIGGNSKKGGVKLNDDDYEKMTVKGTCKVLEKEYLRLTAPPKANLVRPEPILKKHLINLKKLRKIQSGKSSCSSSGAKRKDYNWFCSQLKAIRQDLTVQRIFNEFAVQVYEFHAKTALEEGDLNEYNQSQTQLKELYEIVDDPYPTIGKGDKSKSKGLENQNEFIAYRIIYYVFMTGNKKYEGGSTDLFKIMLSLSPEQRLDSFISHALKVRIAVADNDYHAFFRLQDKAPSMAAYLMDFIVPSIRASGLKCMMKAYRPTISAEFVLIELGFVFNGKVDKKEGIAWLKGCGCKFNSDRDLIVAKDSVLVGSVVAGVKTSSLI